MSKEEEPEFRVTDKRIFRENGDVQGESSEKPPQKGPESGVLGAADSRIPAAEEPPEPGMRIDFTSYTLSYYTQGLVLLGEVPNPYTNKKDEDMEGARHMIDILSMLEEKTKGNLSGQEQQLLESVLYELRMKFMAKTKTIKL
jgi:hypothetical protein